MLQTEEAERWGGEEGWKGYKIEGDDFCEGQTKRYEESETEDWANDSRHKKIEQEDTIVIDTTYPI